MSTPKDCGCGVPDCIHVAERNRPTAYSREVFSRALDAATREAEAVGLDHFIIVGLLLATAAYVMRQSKSSSFAWAECCTSAWRAVDSAMRERRHVQEVKINAQPIPHAGKCACGEPAQVLRTEKCPDGSVAAVYAARRWFGALYPACAAHADAGVILPGQIVRPS